MIGNVFRLYLPVFGGLVGGAWIGGVVLVGGVARAGSGGGGGRHSTFPGDELGYDDGDDWDNDDN